MAAAAAAKGRYQHPCCVPELRNLSFELRNVSFELRNVSVELRNVSFVLQSRGGEGGACCERRWVRSTAWFWSP